MSTDSNDLLRINKSKSNASKKKSPKKQKTFKNINKNVAFGIKVQKTEAKSKPKETELTPKYNVATNVFKGKKLLKVTTEMSPYFYSVNNSKYKNAEEGVKPYLKFVKNITITYPIMIPSRDNVKSRDSFKKSPKQKEKSRDLNSNRNLKIFSSKPVEATTFIDQSMTNTKGKIAGN